MIDGIPKPIHFKRFNKNKIEKIEMRGWPSPNIALPQ